jgi:hypothetical protein
MTDEEERQLTLLAIRKLREVRLEALNATEAHIRAQAEMDFLSAKIEAYKHLIDEAKFEQQLQQDGGISNEKPVERLVLIPDTIDHGPDPA